MRCVRYTAHPQREYVVCLGSALVKRPDAGVLRSSGLFSLDCAVLPPPRIVDKCVPLIKSFKDRSLLQNLFKIALAFLL